MNSTAQTASPTGTWFQPADEREHGMGSAGYPCADYCRNCNQPFMAHTNGACPPDEPDAA